MGRKWIIPYGLYRGYGYFSPAYAQESGFSAKDLTLFWDALIHVWENDHSAARGRLGLHGLYVFSHNNARGNAPDHELFDHIQVQRRDGIQYPRSIHDYEIVVRELDMPAGVTLTKLVG